VYTPGHFAEADLALLDALALKYPFATLITMSGGEPFVSHLPVLYRRDEHGITLQGHWSRANPQWRHDGQAKLILQGPHAYISPSWYPDKEMAARVPTWNYAVAHLSGPLEIVEDEAGLAAIVSALTSSHEDEVGSDWRFEIEREELRSQLRGIVGFALRPEKIELKFKLSQNHPEANIRNVAGQLPRTGVFGNAVAGLMLDQLTRRAMKDSP
jgi:transcriptional regulator